jgi:hypothetical protein
MTPRQTLEQVRSWLLSETRDDDRALVIESQTSAGGHAIVPYSVERKPGKPGVFTIYVYDPNQPLNNSAMIEIDSTANTWKDLTPLNYGSGPTGCYPTLQAWRHLRTLAPESGPVQPGTTVRGGEATAAEPTAVIVPPGADITLVDASGDTAGYRDGRVVRGIDSATVFITPTGGFSPPGKYLLPAGDYRAVLDRFRDTTVSVAIDRDSVFFSYRRAGADSGQRDIFTIGNGVGFHNSDTAAKRIDWKIVFTGDSTQTTFDLENLVHGGGDSLALSGAAGTVRIGGGGAGKTYDLNVKRSSPGGTARFFSPGIALAAGATHEIVPSDDSLSSVVLRIDENSDGVVDDSVSMANELTAVADGSGAGIPAGFSLHPNYPNPFNPSTTVRYEVPERAHVTLRVVDVLGREVATLVDRVEEPGPKRVVWEAGGRPAGVYYLRMNAEGFSATEKMLLVR